MASFIHTKCSWDLSCHFYYSRFRYETIEWFFFTQCMILLKLAFIIKVKRAQKSSGSNVMASLASNALLHHSIAMQHHSTGFISFEWHSQPFLFRSYFIFSPHILLSIFDVILSTRNIFTVYIEAISFWFALQVLHFKHIYLLHTFGI